MGRPHPTRLPLTVTVPLLSRWIPPKFLKTVEVTWSPASGESHQGGPGIYAPGPAVPRVRSDHSSEAPQRRGIEPGGPGAQPLGFQGADHGGERDLQAGEIPRLPRARPKRPWTARPVLRLCGRPGPPPHREPLTTVRPMDGNTDREGLRPHDQLTFQLRNQSSVLHEVRAADMQGVSKAVKQQVLLRPAGGLDRDAVALNAVAAPTARLTAHRHV